MSGPSFPFRQCRTQQRLAKLGPHIRNLVTGRARYGFEPLGLGIHSPGRYHPTPWPYGMPPACCPVATGLFQLIPFSDSTSEVFPFSERARWRFELPGSPSANNLQDCLPRTMRAVPPTRCNFHLRPEDVPVTQPLFFPSALGTEVQKSCGPTCKREGLEPSDDSLTANYTGDCSAPLMPCIAPGNWSETQHILARLTPLDREERGGKRVQLRAAYYRVSYGIRTHNHRHHKPALYQLS